MTKSLNERLTPLILMLSSPVDGEVVAAVRAIERVLKAGGRSWHDLAAMLAPKQATEEEWRKAIKALLHANPEDLTDWDKKFLRSVLGFARISEKQAETLRRIFEKIYEDA